MHLKKFIRTKAKPYVFFLPKTLTSSSEKLVAETCQLIEEEIAKKQKEFESEIEMLTLECVNLSNNDVHADGETDSTMTNSENKTNSNKTDESKATADEIDLNQSLTQLGEIKPQGESEIELTSKTTPNETAQSQSTNNTEPGTEHKDSSSSSSDSELDEEKNNVQLGDVIDEEMADEDEPIKKISSQIAT